ncbi:MAG: glycine/sarcosine/betaine reductase component B subunit, partial [Defluviitaleaceae bacterium]|nr:glycine/sarcosine/betaine reductase component B subunit [Defluviitaleaceae bacterium]
MKLEIGYIDIWDIKFDAQSQVAEGTLYVDADALVAMLLEDKRLAAVEIDIAKPGESVRITPVKDVIEPRAKVSGGGGMFPGIISKVATVGSGVTHVLRGAAIVTCGKIVGFQEGIIDMTGPGADYTPFSKTFNLVLNFTPVDGIAPHDYENALRMAGLKAATFI